MLKLDIYPVMDGFEIWAVGVCTGTESAHLSHRGVRYAAYVSSDRLRRNGLEAAVGFELGLLLTEFPDLTTYARC